MSSGDGVAHMVKKYAISYAEAIWQLYGHKAGMETYFKDALEDLELHHPPYQEYVRNAGFLALGALACILGRAVQVVAKPLHEAQRPAEPAPATGAEPVDTNIQPPATGSAKQAGKAKRTKPRRQRRPPRFMQLWRLRRTLLALPGRIARRARTLNVTLLDVSERFRRQFLRFWTACCRC